MKDNMNLLINRILKLYIYCYITGKSEAIQRNVLRIAIKLFFDKAKIKTEYNFITMNEDKRNDLFNLLQEMRFNNSFSDMNIFKMAINNKNDLLININEHKFVLIGYILDLNKKKINEAMERLSKVLLIIYNKKYSEIPA